MNRRNLFCTCIVAFVARLIPSRSGASWSGVTFNEYSSPKCGGPWLGWLERNGKTIGFLHEDGSYVATPNLAN